ncbi:MAG: DsbA family protein [Acidobacteria bacterium]|nr:DsbA family protein [Acidobacteriota bacterium]
MLKTLNIRTVSFIIALLLPLCLIACQKESSQTDEGVQEESQASGHVLNGSAASLIKIEVFSDLQCPGCRKFFLETIQPVMKDYKDKVLVIYHEFPLSGHPYARPAARYVAAAAKLGPQKVLPVYEAIFTDQAYWATDGSLEESVSKALSMEDFLRVAQILRNASYVAEIDETIDKELQIGLRKGINTTPTMFISYGGKEQKVEGGTNYPVMKQFLDSIVKQ